LAVDAIQLHGITEQVRMGRMKFELEQHEVEQHEVEQRELERAQADNGSVVSPAAVPAIRRWMSPVLQIAAALIVVIVGAGVIKVANTQPEEVFDKNYSDYQLSVTRGADVSDAMEQAYRSRNWAGVYNAFDATHARTQRDYFLTAMAHMQQKEYYEAISLLKTVILYNQSREPYFKDEAEYYLAMNYLATGQAAPAVALFDKIKSDPRHVYHSRVEEMGQLDLRILRIK
jgi:tetratricopeptide (TPR) repeat protein